MSVGLLKVKSFEVQVIAKAIVAVRPRQSSTFTESKIWKELKSTALKSLGQGHSSKPVTELKTKSEGVIAAVEVNLA